MPMKMRMREQAHIARWKVTDETQSAARPKATAYIPKDAGLARGTERPETSSSSCRHSAGPAMGTPKRGGSRVGYMLLVYVIHRVWAPHEGRGRNDHISETGIRHTNATEGLT